jgi:hypothetical protein
MIPQFKKKYGLRPSTKGLETAKKHTGRVAHAAAMQSGRTMRPRARGPANRAQEGQTPSPQKLLGGQSYIFCVKEYFQASDYLPINELLKNPKSDIIGLQKRIYRAYNLWETFWLKIFTLAMLGVRW